VAESQVLVDRVGALKILWLRRMLVPKSNVGTVTTIDERGDLREAGLGWFAHFTERWRRLADCCELPNA
jgi:hypothetical protein